MKIWCEKNLLSILSWLQIAADSYLKMVTISTYDTTLDHTTSKVTFSLVPSTVLIWKFVWCYSQGSFKRNRHYWFKYNLKIMRNELWYLANEFGIKKHHFLELPDTIVKYYSDKFVEKKPYSLENSFSDQEQGQHINNLHQSARPKIFCGLPNLSFHTAIQPTVNEGIVTFVHI